MKDFCVIVQGPSEFVEDLKKSWFGFDIIWSTWKGQEINYTEEDIVIFNDIPSETGIANIRLQQLSTIKGVEKALELGYKRVLKWRSDIISNNPEKLISCFKKDSINFLSWHVAGKYFIDYFMESDIEDMFKIWDFDTFDGPYPERIITDNIFKKGLENFNFCCGELDSGNEIYWKKKGIFLSEFKSTLAYDNKIS